MSSKKTGNKSAEKRNTDEMSAFRAYILNSAKNTRDKMDSPAQKARESMKNAKEGTNTTMSTAKKTTENVTKTAKSAAKTVKATAAKKATSAKATAKKSTAATKTAAKKTATAAKTTVKKAAAKKTTPKTNVELQFAGKSISYDSLVKTAKEAFVNAGHKESEMKSIALYVKPEESMVYYVINDEQGSFAI